MSVLFVQEGNVSANKKPKMLQKGPHLLMMTTINRKKVEPLINKSSRKNH